MTIRIALSDALLHRLYVDEGLSLAEVGDRVGYSASGVARRLRQAGIPRRSPGGRTGQRRVRPDPATLADITARYRAGDTLTSIASCYGRSVWWVRDRLAMAGEPSRSRPASPGPVRASREQVEAMKALYVEEGRSLAEVGVAVRRSQVWVSRELKAAGVRIRGGGTVDIDEDLVRCLYEDEQLSSTTIAARLGVSRHRVLTVLGRLGVSMRRSGTRRLPYTCDELRRLYVDERRSTVEIAAAAGMSASGISVALHRCGIPTRSGGAPLTIPTAELRRLYVDERLDRADIAARYGVATWAVTRRLRTDGIRRPPAMPPSARPSPPGSELRLLYVEENRSQAEIATIYQVPRLTVRRWLDNAGIPLRARSGAGASSNQPTPLDPVTLEDLYVGHELTSSEVGRRLGVTSRVILTALHQHGIPVRPSGPRRPGQARILLEELYGDPIIVDTLTRHHIPRRPNPGPLRGRWPTPASLTGQLLEDLYLRIGLSSTHISLLTGQYESHVVTALQQAGVHARTDHDRSPWTQHNLHNGP